VRKSAIFEGPAGICGVEVPMGFKVLAAPRRLRDLAREELLVEDAILWVRRYAGTGVPWYHSCGGLELSVRGGRGGRGGLSNVGFLRFSKQTKRVF